MWQGDRVSALLVRCFPLAMALALAAPWMSPGAPASPDLGLHAAPSISQSPLFRWRDSNGRLQMGPRNEVLSHNWSGYGLSGGPYTSVQGSWVVPAVSYQAYPGSPGIEATSTWLGIGGQDGDDTLIQIGTQQMAAPSGETAYFAWYEILPASEVPIDPKQFPVSGGDTIDAAIQCIAACAPNTKSTWRLTLTNGKRWPKPYTLTLQYASSLASAEWIVEGPCVKNCSSSAPGFAYLPNYGSTTFSAITVNDTIPELALSPNGIVMKDPNGNATSTPSAPLGGNSFTVSFAI